MKDNGRAGAATIDEKEDAMATAKVDAVRTHANGKVKIAAEKSAEDELPTASPGPPKSVFREYFESAVVTFIMALFGMTFIVQAVKVPTGSMQNTITIGDHLLVNKFIFPPGSQPLPFLPQREIRRGDIIVFKYPGYANRPLSEQLDEPNNIPYKTNYVKRVIGLPGEHIVIKGKDIYINDVLLPERHIPAIDHSDDSRTPGDEKSKALEVNTAALPPRTPEQKWDAYYSNFALGREIDVVVPENSYLAMGDNRNNSLDGREWGFVRRDLIIGRALFVYWSYDESAPPSEGFFGNLTDFFRNTRWRRTGTMIK